MECPQPGIMPQDLAEALKEATKEVHTQAENAELMRNILKRQVTREGLKMVTASLCHVYMALEESNEGNKDDPVFAPLYCPRSCTPVSLEIDGILVTFRFACLLWLRMLNLFHAFTGHLSFFIYDLITSKSFCMAKEIFNSVKREVTDWEKYLPAIPQIGGS